MDELISNLPSIVRFATPLVLAAVGETITEKAGVVNLSLDGSIVLASLAGFVAAYTSGSILVGLAAAALVGTAMALLVAFASLTLKQDQVAVGFVLTLLAVDLAKFLGRDYRGQSGLCMTRAPVPLLSDLPVLGPTFFNQDVLVYFGFTLIIAAWWFMYRTRPGMALRGVGERPEAAFARGAHVNRLRYLYAAVGGALVGLAGAHYTLAIKCDWAANPSMVGQGWIALAIVIFGGWHPFKVAFGAYLYGALRTLASLLQQSTDLPVVLINAVPWLLMILTLLLVSSGFVDRLIRITPHRYQPVIRALLRSDSPKALGVDFERE
ncbi:MAG: ABC transporter permease [Anaerolineae bacterium]|nr:ABC transporter permease [Anaerolineae bacterium]